jgi:hypothetical protein
MPSIAALRTSRGAFALFAGRCFERVARTHTIDDTRRLNRTRCLRMRWECNRALQEHMDTCGFRSGFDGGQTLSVSRACGSAQRSVLGKMAACDERSARGLVWCGLVWQRSFFVLSWTWRPVSTLPYALFHLE